MCIPTLLTQLGKYHNTAKGLIGMSYVICDNYYLCVGTSCWQDCEILDYTVKNQKLLKTGCNNLVGTTLFNVVNNIVQHCYT